MYSIGLYAFNGSAYYKDNNNWENDVLYVGNHLITAKPSLNGIYAVKEGTKSIASYAFRNCTDLTGLIFPEGLKSIGSYTFSGCSALDSIYVPDSVNRLGANSLSSLSFLQDNEDNWTDGALYAGNHLIDTKNDAGETITVRSGTKTIAPNSFNGSSAKKVIIPRGLRTIDQYAFYYSNITEIVLPDSISEIRYGAFEDSSGLTDVYYMGSEADFNRISIEGNNDYLLNANIHFSVKETDPQTFTIYTKDGNITTFSVTPSNTEIGKTVIIALYNNGVLVDFKQDLYTGASLDFSSSVKYDEALAMIWDSISLPKPVSAPEYIQ